MFNALLHLLQGWGGIGAEVFLSLPCILGKSGSTRLAGVSLAQEEDSKLRNSVTSLCNLISQLRIWRIPSHCVFTDQSRQVRPLLNTWTVSALKLNAFSNGYLHRDSRVMRQDLYLEYVQCYNNICFSLELHIKCGRKQNWNMNVHFAFFVTWMSSYSFLLRNIKFYAKMSSTNLFGETIDYWFVKDEVQPVY